MIKFVLASVTDFDTANIDISAERHSVDGTKALKHIELLTAEELNSIRTNMAFQFIGDEEVIALMATEEWSAIASE